MRQPESDQTVRAAERSHHDQHRGGPNSRNLSLTGSYGALAHPMTCPVSVLEERDQLLSDGFGVSHRAEMSSAGDVDDAGMIERFVETAQCVFEVIT